MALGGGTWLTQSKTLPGTYINFVSASRASAALSDRGIATMPLSLDWGVDDAIFTVTSEDFQKDSLKIFGYPYTHDNMKGLRDLFLNIRIGHFFKLNTGGAKAENTYAVALYKGARGNDLKIVIEAGEGSTVENPKYDVSTYLGSVMVDSQNGVSAMTGLVANEYVSFKSEATIALTAGTPLVGGTDGTVEDAAYQTYLDKIEQYSFNAMGCNSTSATVKGLLSNFTKRMRDERGVKFQCVLFKYTTPDHEGIISVENGLVGLPDDPSAVYWATGAQAGCAINESLTNAAYTGEYAVDTDYTQTQLEDGIRAGKLMFHRVDSEIHILKDINTFTSTTDEKSKDFSSNQVVRVLDQIGNDIGALFNTKYLGKAPNDASGRVSLWGDIVKHHQELQSIRAIENFNGDSVTVSPGESKNAVVVEDYVTPISAMEQLYMKVIVS